MNKLETSDLKEIYNKMLSDFKNELTGESPNKVISDIFDALSSSVKEFKHSHNHSEMNKVNSI